MKRLFLALFLLFSPLYGEDNINQTRLIKQFTRYLKLKKRDKEPKNDYKSGLCNGFAFLAQYYATLGQEEDFFRTLQAFSAWDGTQKGLEQTIVGFGCHQKLAHLFERWINDLIWFQSEYVELEMANNSYFDSQSKRIEQFEAIKDPKDDRQIAMRLHPVTLPKVTPEQLEELLEIWSCFPNTILEFGGGGHATSGRVLEDGTFSYYDANDDKQLPVIKSPKELARRIQRTKYREMGMKGKKMEIELMAYQYLSPDEKIKPSKTYKKKTSSNGFTPYHMAIFSDNLESLRTLLQEKRSDPNASDVHGLTPLNLAVLMENTKAIELLLAYPQIDLDKSVDGLSPILAAIQSLNCETTILLLQKGASLFATAGGLQLPKIIADKLDTGDIPAVMLTLMKSPREISFVKQLCRQFPECVKMQDSRGNTLLHYAVLFENSLLMDTLINEGAPIDIKNNKGKTAYDLF